MPSGVPIALGLAHRLPKGRSMRPIARVLALALLLAPQGALAAGDTVFAGTQVLDINIEFSQVAWWDSLVTYYEAGLEQMLAAVVTIDGVAIDSVGVRLKGNASYTHPNDKKPFRLAFDEYRDDQRWDELKGVHLNNCWEDPTFIREKLHLDFCRDAGVPAPRGNFADLSLNGEHWGFYSLVEHVDKTFMSSRFGNNDGNRYKAVDGFLGGPLSDFKWYGSDPSSYVSRYELKSDSVATTWHDLIAVIDSLNNTASVATALPPVLNLTSLYRALATDILMASLDSYVGSCRNFYLYFEETTGRLEWVVWDTGMSFGSYWSAAQNYETLGLTYVSSTANRPLAAKIFADPTLSQEYLVALCGLYSNYFSSERLLPQVTALADFVRPYVYADPRKMYTDAQFETNLTTDITVGGHRKPGLVAFITAREVDVADQLDALGVSCESSIEPGDVVINEFAASNTLILDPAGEAEDWIELYNTTDAPVDLSGMYLSDDPAAVTMWQFPAGTVIGVNEYLIVWADDDDGQEGLHAAFKLSASGEQILLSDTQAVLIDSVTFGAQTADLTMARIPNGTGDFVQGTPTFGRHNGFGNACAAGQVAINELMADSDSYTDPAGEAEDWVELYNNTDSELSLGGLYLSDNFASPAKWMIPDGVSIPAHGYLLVWADSDLDQEGLHADFKLSAGGEAVILSNPDFSVVDSLSFGAQQTDWSWARIPDGTGAFEATSLPTPGAANQGSTAADGLLPTRLYLARAVPNPSAGRARIQFSLPTAGRATLEVFDVGGRRVASLVDGELAAGVHSASFDGAGLAAGVYLYRLHAAGETAAGRLLIIK